MFLHRNSSTITAMSVKHAMSIIARHMNRAVNDKARRVHRIIAIAQQVSFAINFNQGRRRYLLKEHAEGV